MAWMAYLWMGAAALVGAGMTLWGGYYLVTALMSWRKPMDYGRHPASTRFAILVAARNEELVIGNLINSLLAQDYPRELYDIWVIPNNCTDHTAQAARDFGANVMECTVPVKCKGDVMRFAYRQLRDKGYDAFCVFDADNVADPRFLREMNNAYRAGARAAQGYRDSKNPFDSAISGCYSIYYWMMDRFHNQGKAGLGMSAMLGGTGFMVSAAAFDKMGGWSTQSISEDLEMSAQCALAGVPIAWVPKAVTYDEQPLTFRESIKQRRRWTSGTLQIAGEWLPVLGRSLAERPAVQPLDMGATMLIPAYQAAALVSMAVTALAAGFVHPGHFSLLLCLGYIAGNLLITVLGATLSAVLVITVENKWDRRLLPALAVYWFFLLSWVVLTVGCIFKKTTVWEEIRHTRNVSMPKGGKMKRSNQVLAP